MSNRNSQSFVNPATGNNVQVGPKNKAAPGKVSRTSRIPHRANAPKRGGKLASSANDTTVVQTKALSDQSSSPDLDEFGGLLRTESPVRSTENETGQIQRKRCDGDKKKKRDKAKEKKRKAAITARWEALLGERLGGEMAAVVLKHVSVDALNGYVTGALDAAGPALGAALEGAVEFDDGKESAQKKALKEFSDALSGAIASQVETWKNSPTGQKILGKLSGFVQKNPGKTLGIVGSVAIGAAVVAYFANPDVPNLEIPLKLGDGWTLKTGVDLGTLQTLAYQGASLTLSNKAKGFSIALKHKDGDKGGETTLEASGKIQATPKTSFQGKADLQANKSETKVKLSGGLSTSLDGQNKVSISGGVESKGKKVDKITGKIRVGENDNYREIIGTKNGDTVTFKTVDVFGRVSVERTSTAGPDGVKDTANVKYQQNRVGGSNVDIKGHAGTEGFGMGAIYHQGLFKSNLDYAMKSGVSTLKLGASYQPKKGLIGDFDLQISDTRLTEMSMKFGYRDVAKFRSLMLDYKRSWVQDNEEYAHHFGALLEYSFGQVSARLTGGIDYSAGQIMGTQLDLMGGMRINNDWAAIGGARYNNSPLDGRQSFRFYSGLQYKNIGVAGYVDMPMTGGKATAGIMLTVPLGFSKNKNSRNKK